MQITINLTAEQEAALTYVAAKANIPGNPAVTPENYFRARVGDLLASYADVERSDDTRLIADAFKIAPEADRLAVFAALKIARSVEAAEL